MDFSEFSRLGLRLYGEDGNDQLYGSPASDTLLGGAGDDTIYGGMAGDYINGGAGDDTLYLSGDLTKSKIIGIERLAPGDITVGAGGLSQFEEIMGPISNLTERIYFTAATNMNTDKFTTRSPFGKISLFGSQHDDKLNAHDATVRFILNGRGGDDVLWGGLKATELYGGAGDDVIHGSNRADTIQGGDGDDVLIGGSGNDLLEADGGAATVNGGLGNDHLIGREVVAGDKQIILGGAGNDIFEYWVAGKDAGVTLSGGVGNDSLYMSGNISKMHITGIESITFMNTLIGTPEQLSHFTKITGTSNNVDTFLKLSTGGTFVWHGGSIERGTLMGSAQADTIDIRKPGLGAVYAGAGNDVIHADGGHIFGDSGNDILYAGTKDTEMYGGAGRDTLVGGTGDDSFFIYDYNQAGRDTLVFRRDSGFDSVNSFVATGAGHDVMDLSALHLGEDFHDFMADHVYRSADAYGSVIYLSKGNVTYLSGVLPEQLHAYDFIF